MKLNEDVRKAKIKELEIKLKECQKEAYKQLEEARWMENLLIKVAEIIEKHIYHPKYIVADFIARAKIKCYMNEHMPHVLFSEREGITFRGMEVINAEECLILLEEEEE